MQDIALARSHVKYLTLGIRSGDDNASLLRVFEGWSRLFCHTNVVRIVTPLQKIKKYMYILYSDRIYIFFYIK